VEDLDESDAALDEPARHQAELSEGPRRILVETVHPSRLLGLPLDLERLRHRRLHAEGQLAGID